MYITEDYIGRRNMDTFFEWCKKNNLTEAFGQDNPFLQASGYGELSHLFSQYKGSIVKFRQDGQTMMGKLINLLDEGVFIVRTQDGVEHDVNPQEIIAVSGGRQHEPEKQFQRAVNSPLSNKTLGNRMQRKTFG